MRNLKKFLALVMAMVMAFSLMLTVNAKDVVKSYSDSDQVTDVFVEAVDVLSGMKVFQGDEEAPTFRPASNITRGEVAAIIYRLATGDVNTDKKDLYTTVTPFTDVSADDWFAPMSATAGTPATSRAPPPLPLTPMTTSPVMRSWLWSCAPWATTPTTSSPAPTGSSTCLPSPLSAAC